MQETIALPRTIGSTTLVKLDAGKDLHIFLIDADLPLFNVRFGQLKFFANADQLRQQVTAYREAGTGEMPVPTWKWQFDSGFEKSIDGKADKGWRLLDV
ncbi:hypothetical protein OVY01_04800 [Robbsia sp. Bb-Pol-6]|uniref:Uncharacterized protein n=1 Tax=Robbsia betulipollinis TaxID=2981849 RepID=A0ABT3ZJ83_9BURK|nr:hypothetical protein [Robbsia betulipollinis]MCY0386566.1 hypothetical protein [Robbsia betulipollinis]